MTVELERLFRQIVVNLAAADPARLRRPLPLADIRDSIVPYRANRRSLHIESSEDYELALMQLGAGEGGLARTEPAEVQAEFASEIRSPNPDLTIVQRHEKAVLSLNPQAVARVIDAKPDLAFAPPQPAILEEDRETGWPATDRPDSIQVEGPLRCHRCGCSLPAGRPANFCPQCGQNLAHHHCPQCNTELDAAWKHCIGCGLPLGSNPP